MKVLFDTSVLVAAMVTAHPRHPEAASWLSRAKSGEIELLASTHTLAELYSILSTLPMKPRISPAEAWRLIQENVVASARLIALSPDDYSAVLRETSAMGLSGGVIYDALIVCAARKAGADRLLTLNQKDFRRVWPDGQSILATP